MSDESYFRRRAEVEAGLARAALHPDVRLIHEALHKAYLDRADSVGPGRQRPA